MIFLWERMRELGGLGTVSGLVGFLAMCAYLRYNGVDLTAGYLVICGTVGLLTGAIVSKAIAFFLGKSPR